MIFSFISYKKTKTPDAELRPVFFCLCLMSESL